MEVHCHSEKYDKDLLPGMYMNADLEISGKSATALADEAIVPFYKKQYVFFGQKKEHLYNAGSANRQLRKWVY